MNRRGYYMKIADKIYLTSKGDLDKLVTICDKRKVDIKYLPLVTNKYIFKDGSSITISQKIHYVGLK